MRGQRASAAARSRQRGTLHIFARSARQMPGWRMLVSPRTDLTRQEPGAGLRRQLANGRDLDAGCSPSLISSVTFAADIKAAAQRSPQRQFGSARFWLGCVGLWLGCVDGAPPGRADSAGHQFAGCGWLPLNAAVATLLPLRLGSVLHGFLRHFARCKRGGDCIPPDRDRCGAGRCKEDDVPP
jgi:hypothetical protein